MEDWFITWVDSNWNSWTEPVKISDTIKEVNLWFNLVPKENKTYNYKDLINFDVENQVVRIWKPAFKNFNELFRLLKVKVKQKHQFKWWLWLLYSIVKYIQIKWTETDILACDLLAYYNEFKNWIERKNWEFEGKWAKKGTISKTDCERARSILSSWGVSIKVALLYKNRNNENRIIKFEIEK